MPTLRRQGVFGYNLPAQVGSIVQPAAFNIVGQIGRFARGISGLLDINQVSEIPTKLGGYKEGFLGRYVLESVFANLRGQPCKVWVKPFVASNAVQASSIVQDIDGSPENTLSIRAAYNKLIDKSEDGNKTGYTLVKGNRFSTTLASSASLGDTSIVLTSIIGVRVGDILQINSTVFTKVSAIDEGTRTCTVGALSAGVTSGDLVNAKGFRIVTYRKNQNGVSIKQNLVENDIWLSMEPENTEFYIENAFANHPWLDITDLASTNSGFNKYPVDVTTITYLTSGSDGTSPSSASDWNLYSAFDNKDIRFLFNSDSSLKEVNEAGENYCTNRLDTPIWMYHIPKNQTKNQLITIGQGYQRSNQVQGLIASSYRSVINPIGVGANPTIEIPVVGGVTGNIVYSFYAFGFHRAAAGDDMPLLGFTSSGTTNEDNFTEDERTELCQAGINITQNIPGRGLLLRSFYTPSTNLGALFANYLVMQNFIKISSVESLYKVENRPNRLSSLKIYADSIKDFGKKLYDGSFPFGIDSDGAFGEFTKQDGTLSGFEDVFIVQADQFNNPNSQIIIGEGNIFVRFFPAAPLTSLGIGVGVTIPV
jgi:hypothetical protein